jgi:hypothetical protein
MQFALDFAQKLAPATQARIHDGMKQADENAETRWKHIFDGCVLAAARKKPLPHRQGQHRPPYPARRGSGRGLIRWHQRHDV